METPAEAQPEWFGQAADDVVDGEVDPLEVRQGRGGSGALGNSQDLASPPQFGRYDDPRAQARVDPLIPQRK